MTFKFAALQDRPLALCIVDDSVQDYSGNGVVPSTTVAPATHLPMIKGAKHSLIFTQTTTLSHDSPIFIQGDEEASFTLAAWVRAFGAASEQQVLGNPNQMDGLVINGTVVSFVTKYTTAAEARCSFDLQVPRAAALWGVHTETKNLLYVDGELVDEVVLSEEQQAAQFVATGTTLSAGATVGAQMVAINGLASYIGALPPASIAKQFAAGIDVPDETEVTAFSGGNSIPVTIDVADVFLSQTWNEEADWTTGEIHNVGIVDDELVPQFDGDTSVEGYWTDSFALASSGLLSIHGVSLYWDGEGVVVEVSLDGVTWEVATRGKNLALIPPAFDPTNQLLELRVSFLGGIVDDPAHLSSLTAIGMTDNVSQELMGRTITYTDATPNYIHRPLKLHEDWGAKVGGSLTISADLLESLPARTIELWIKRNGVNPTVNVTGAYYQNGEISTSTLIDGQWLLVHIVADADVTGDIVVTGPVQIGAVGIYDIALSAADISAIYAAYTGTDSLLVSGNSVVTVSQAIDSASIYAADWSIAGAG